MVRILYGLAGEGMGHATRSKVVISHLLSKGHTVTIVASDRACDFMERQFGDVHKIPGLRISYKDNSVEKLKTVWMNLKPRDGAKAVEIVRGLIKERKPDLIITDYEPTVAHLAGMMDWKGLLGVKKIPLLSIDNMHILSNCRIEVPKEHIDDYAIVKLNNQLLVPPINIRKYLITTFFYPPVRQKDTLLIPSLLREGIVRAVPSYGDCILVYQTSKSNTGMFDILKGFNRERFIIYGFNERRKDGNLTFTEFSEEGFIDDLAQAKAVITNGGFSLMSEAVYLHKPVFSVPVRKQFEQVCNAIYLEKEGYGEYHREVTSRGLAGFLYSLPDYQQKLMKYSQEGNLKALAMIDIAIEECMR